MRTIYRTLLCLSCLGATSAVAAPSEAWIYASRLDLTGLDAGTWATAEGKDVHWFHTPQFEQADTSTPQQSGADARQHLNVKFTAGVVRLIDDKANDRNFYGENTLLWVVYVYPLAGGTCGNSKMSLTADPQPRFTALLAGVNAIFARASSGSQKAVGANAEEPKATKDVCVDIQSVPLKDARDLVKLTFTGPDSAGKAPQYAHTVITGTKEHAFLSGDVITRKLSELKFDSDTSTVSEKAKPSTVYGSFNWQIGDVYQHNTGWSTDRVVVKAMVAAASKPLDSVGVGLGYQVRDFIPSTGGTDAGAIQVFVGHFWTKGDVGPRKKEVRLGLGFNIDTALSWVFGKSGS